MNSRSFIAEIFTCSEASDCGEIKSDDGDDEVESEKSSSINGSKVLRGSNPLNIAPVT